MPISRNLFQRTDKGPSSPVWNHLLTSLLVLALGIATTGALAIEAKLAATAQKATADFRWLVLVRGTQLQIDEVGSYLKKLDGVEDASLISPSDVVDQLKKEPLLSGDSDLLDPALLPPSWEVRWSPEHLRLEDLQDTLDEVKTVPGVIDIAFDQHSLDRLHQLRLHRLELDAVLGLAGMVTLIFLFILYGRLLFFTGGENLDVPRLIAMALVDGLSWAAGYFLIVGIVAPASWYLCLGGLLVGAIRYSVISVRK